MVQTKEVHVTLVRRYRQVEKQCQQCRAVFVGSPLKVYCTVLCAKRANWHRHSAEYIARRKSKQESAR